MSARYTLILGTKNLSSWSLRPWLAMRATGAAFSEIVLPLDAPETRAAILAHSPSGRVPALRIDEGGTSVTVHDSLAICETLAERHPDAMLWPRDPRARAEARSVTAEMHAGFAKLRETLPMDFARRRPAPALGDAVKTEIGRIVQIWTRALAQGDREGGFLFGRFSIADCFYAPVASRFRTYAIGLPGEAGAYVERLFALDAMKDWGAAAAAEIAQGLGTGTGSGGSAPTSR